MSNEHMGPLADFLTVDEVCKSQSLSGKPVYGIPDIRSH
jgi:hypothetical protein